MAFADPATALGGQVYHGTGRLGIQLDLAENFVTTIDVASGFGPAYHLIMKGVYQHCSKMHLHP